MRDTAGAILGIWPYCSPRVEFLLQGFGEGDKHLFVFWKDKSKTSNGDEVDMARCDLCKAKIHATDEVIKDHARLHLAVKLAHAS
jgi:hypothetical protein